MTDEHDPAAGDMAPDEDRSVAGSAGGADDRVRRPMAEFLSEQLKAVTDRIQRINLPWMAEHNLRMRQILQPSLQTISDRMNASPAALAASRLAAARLPVLELPEIASFQSKITDVLERLDLEGFQQRMRAGCPPNWRDLEDDFDLWDLIEITEGGLPTAWVPRRDVLVELLGAADDTSRRQVFRDRRVVVFEDCRAALTEVTSPDLAEFVDLLEQALDVAEAGHLAAAQALAASIFDTVIRREIKPQKVNGYYGKVKQEIQDRHDNADMSELRWGVVFIPAVAVLEKFDAPKGDPVPTSFNRHASAHAVGAVQYTETNAVIAVTLSTSMVREAHEQLVEVPDPQSAAGTTMP